MVDRCPLVTHDFPLRLDLTVQLCLPVVLTREDVRRLERFVEALVFVEMSDEEDVER